MPYTREGVFEWEVPAKVLSVLEADRFLADADLGFGIHLHMKVVVSGISAPRDLAARKEAQKLLQHADVVLRCLGQAEEGWLCEVGYGPYFTPRSEQGSFVAAMLAAGHAVAA